MDRTEALAWLNTAGFDGVMTKAGRLTTDSAGGYGPGLDRAFALYITVNSLDTTVTTTDVADADAHGFTYLLSAVTYDLVLPAFALKMDASVDAPLANLKRSQMYRQLKELRDDAWLHAGAYGYDQAANVGGWSFNLDFKEPSDDSAGEF